MKTYDQIPSIDETSFPKRHVITQSIRTGLRALQILPNPSPRSDYQVSHDPRVRFMCSFGGKILPRPHDNQLRYVGGDTRIVAVHRSTAFSTLITKLSKLSGIGSLSVKYQLPNEDLDALISVTTDEDVENMMDEFDRVFHDQNPRSARLRLFLFSTTDESRASSISSLLDGSTKRENWFIDAFNSGTRRLERGRSEASSIVSEVPDYLFGLENSDEGNIPREPKVKSRFVMNDNVSASDPGSPAPGCFFTILLNFISCACCGFNPGSSTR
ncbi:hypothetical protein OIU78_024593 [Salix suchowensis]|nr:hypothetical protein OIU78_024593 [Salix suchowensis]